MHKMFGQADGFCKDCVNFKKNNRHKKLSQVCEAFGAEWNASHLACGLYPNTPYAGKKIGSLITRKKKNNDPIEGQLNLHLE